MRGFEATAVAGQVPPGVVHHLLADEPLVAVVARWYSLAGRTGVPLDELAAAGWFVQMRGEWGLRLQVDAAFARAGVDRTVAFELGRSDAVVRFAGLGCGAALVPASTAEGVADVAVLTLDGPAARHPIGLVRRSPHPPPRVHVPL